MTVDVNDRLDGPYLGNGVTTAFAYSFLIIANTELRVILRDDDGVDTTQTLTTDYSVSGVGVGAGNVTFVVAPPTGSKVIIEGNTPKTQTVNYVENERFPYDSHQAGMDKLERQLQEVQRDVDRAVKYPHGETVYRMPIKPSETKYLAQLPTGEIVHADFDLIDFGGSTPVSAGWGDIFSSPPGEDWDDALDSDLGDGWAAALNAPYSPFSGPPIDASWLAIIEDPIGDEWAGALAADLGTGWATKLAAAFDSVFSPFMQSALVVTTAHAFAKAVDGSLTLQTYAALQALTSPAANVTYRVMGRAAAGDGGGGTFRWASSNQAGNIAVDTVFGVYVPPTSDLTGLNGAWVRQGVTELDPRWFGAKWDGTTDDSTANERACFFAHGFGGATVGFRGPYTTRWKNAQIRSNVTIKSDENFVHKLPSGAVSTDQILRNAFISTYTDSNIHIIGGIWDGNGAQQTGAQSRFTEMVGLQRVTNFTVKVRTQNCGYVGVALAGVRHGEIDIFCEGVGFIPVTANGGPPVWLTNASGDQSEHVTGKITVKNCYWAPQVTGRNVTVEIHVDNGKEAGLYSPHFPSLDIICENIVLADVQINGVTQHYISSSGLELGGNGFVVNGGHISHTDHASITYLCSAAELRNFGAFDLVCSDFNQDSLGASPQASGITILALEAAPNNPRNGRFSNIIFKDEAKTSTVTIANGSPGTVTWAAHRLEPFDCIVLTTTGTLPAGYTPSVKYYVCRDGLTYNTFRLSATKGGAAINTSSAGSGTHTATKAVRGHAAVGIGGGGDAAVDVVFSNCDMGTAAWVYGDPVYNASSKFGAGSKVVNCTNCADFIPTTTQASASTVTLNTYDDKYQKISGTTTIASWGASHEGDIRQTEFTGALQLTYNATSMKNLTSANITTAAGDVATWRCEGGSNWKMIHYNELNGTALA